MAVRGGGGALALHYYRAILRAARDMPSKLRREHVKKKARLEFEAARGETDPSKVQFALDYAALQLETIRIQAASLSRLANDPLYHNRHEI